MLSRKKRDKSGKEKAFNNFHETYLKPWHFYEIKLGCSIEKETETYTKKRDRNRKNRMDISFINAKIGQCHKLLQENKNIIYICIILFHFEELAQAIVRAGESELCKVGWPTGNSCGRWCFIL